MVIYRNYLIFQVTPIDFPAIPAKIMLKQEFIGVITTENIYLYTEFSVNR